MVTSKPAAPVDLQNTKSGVGCPACIETVITWQFHLRRVMARGSASVVADRAWGKH